ncbi:DUF485 domain-containing protein [Ureibacillus manganicus]|uniref:Membrane protein n=1 Tax=Ureibacillus manganicus DSM 26584 TaxID=1384049 RepID=A0A0A3IVK5_9BACL|nr:DUF485 domain-containing protein [Ureibacillus manganicus]KGR78847.1 membrane protein [Ureibacillus manganicus DSM 26584]
MAKEQKVIDYDKIAELESFKKLTKKKNKFLWTVAVIFFTVYMLLPVLTSYTNLLHQKAIGEITWVWLYSAGLFIMVWGLAHFYVSKATGFDKDAADVISEYEGGARK